MSFVKHFQLQNVSFIFVLGVLLLLGFLTPSISLFLLFGIALSVHYYICLILHLENGYSPFFTPILTAVFYALSYELLPDFSNSNGAFAIAYVCALTLCFLMDKFLAHRQVTHNLLATSILVSTFVAVLFAF